MSGENAQQLRLALEHESNTIRRQKLLKQIWSLAKSHPDHTHRNHDAGSPPDMTPQVADTKVVKRCGTSRLQSATT